MDPQGMMDQALAQTLLHVRPARGLKLLCGVPGRRRADARPCSPRARVRPQVEAALDAEIEKSENLDEDDYARIKAKRIEEMKMKAQAEQDHMSNGHGKLMKINDQQEFFGAAKKSNKMVVIFTRNSNKYGKAMLEHAELLAGKHMEARFLWVDAENAPFLTERLNIYMLPTIVCIMDNKVHKQHNGLNEIDGAGKYTSGTLEYLLHVDGMLDEAPLYDEEIREEEEECVRCLPNH
jgi:hypothetical protein